MAPAAKTAVDTQQFLGMLSNADPHDLPPGRSVFQVNVMVLRPGQLQVRRGLTRLIFDEDD